MITVGKKTILNMNKPKSGPMTGGCGCGYIRYEVKQKPIYVHCCHCSWCQRETGTAFALNAMVETTHVSQLNQAPQIIDTPSASGRGQKIARCPNCQVAVWSHYAGLGELLSFIKVGTLDDVNQMPPDIHIFTSTKQTWLALPEGALVYEEYYDRKQVWNDDQLSRFERLLALKNAQ
jgi:hypothetical protein